MRESDVPEPHSNAVPPPRFLVDWRRCLNALLALALSVVLERVVECVLAVKLEANQTERKGYQGGEHLPLKLGSTSGHQECDDTVGKESANKHAVEEDSPECTA